MSAVGTLDRRVAMLATAQGGALSAKQARLLGAGTKEIRTRLESGRWIVLRRGVYAIGHAA